MATLDPDERALIAAEADADIGLRLGLLALRRLENGGPQREIRGEMDRPRFTGGEFGVQALAAPTFPAQLRIAAASFRAAEKRFNAVALAQARKPEAGETARRESGLYTEAFLRAFSIRYAPPKDDPRNRVHAGLLVQIYREEVVAWRRGPGPPGGGAAAAREAA